MRRRISHLRQLELIDIRTGERLGFADDFAVDTETGKLLAIIRYGKERCFGLFGREKDHEFPFSCVRQIGRQIILLDSGQPYEQDAATDPLLTKDPLAPYYTDHPADKKHSRYHWLS